MTSFFETIKNRRSVRAISKKRIPNSKIQRIIKTSIMGPSAGGMQSFKIFVIKDSKKEILVKAAHDQPYVNSPLVMVFCTDPKKIRKKMGVRGETLFAIQDATIAASYAQLTAAAFGLTSVWVGHFNEKKVKKILKTNLRPIVILPIGYPNEKPAVKKSKSVSRIVKHV